MDKPTEVEIKEFWEWCGCRRCEVEPGTWVCPDRRRYTRCSGIQAGMRKVVDWVEQNSDKGYIFEGTYEYDTKCDNQIFTDLGDWQDKLKEWGVNK